MKYEDFDFKIPTESADYKEASCFVISLSLIHISEPTRPY